jgi:ABC-type molybdenum transport system ATPase subunit/photorepair protein PhrA
MKAWSIYGCSGVDALLNIAQARHHPHSGHRSAAAKQIVNAQPAGEVPSGSRPRRRRRFGLPSQSLPRTACAATPVSRALFQLERC